VGVESSNLFFSTISRSEMPRRNEVKPGGKRLSPNKGRAAFFVL